MVDRRAARARQIQESIEEILLRDWDPLGVRHEPACRDEYNCYVAGVYRLLVSGASVSEVAEHLARKEQRDLGFTTPVERLMGIASRLKTIDLNLDAADDAV